MRFLFAGAAVWVALIASAPVDAAPLSVRIIANVTGTLRETDCRSGDPFSPACLGTNTPFSGFVNRIIDFTDFDGDETFGFSGRESIVGIGEASFSGRVTGSVSPFGNGLTGSEFFVVERDGRQCNVSPFCIYREVTAAAPTFTVQQLNPAPVPEPATWAMMLLGFGAVGYAMRRRRVAVRTGAVASAM